ncbi:MAG: SUMF1/EgtB/PvdO family nonheme iron enzyme [Chitinivibrionales bacterium]|nr:SUMF1/EgtB/PvdO family nonheme iron enzyme [Chitinivibrionales bacterium]
MRPVVDGAHDVERRDGKPDPDADINWYEAVLYSNARSKKEGLDTAYTYSMILYDIGETRLYFDALENVQLVQAANGYRMPLETEWEYACKAGVPHTFDYYWQSGSAGDYAWYSANSSQYMFIKTKLPNNFGLYDMAGNVEEMCSNILGDYNYSSSTKTDPMMSGKVPSSSLSSDRPIRRGGAYNSDVNELRSAYVSFGISDSEMRKKRSYVGFRVVRLVKE